MSGFGSDDPVDILQRAMVYSLISAKRAAKWVGKPGEVIEKLPKSARDILKNLKSDDITEGKVKDVRDWVDAVPDRFKETEKFLKKKFDKFILRKK